MSATSACTICTYKSSEAPRRGAASVTSQLPDERSAPFAAEPTLCFTGLPEALIAIAYEEPGPRPAPRTAALRLERCSGIPWGDGRTLGGSRAGLGRRG